MLRHTDWGEADRLLWIFTREEGKLRAIAKGVRKLRSRKAGHLEPFTRVTLMLAHGRDFWIVTQAETVEPYLPLAEDLLRTGYASYTVELLDRFTYEEGENRPIFGLLTNTLERICAEPDPWLAIRYYEIHLLDLLGFRPEFFQCVECGSEIKPQDQFFSAGLGGLLCPQCGPKALEARAVSQQALRFLRHLQRSSYTVAKRAQPVKSVQQEMEALLYYYITYLLEKNLNSPAFIRRIQQQS